MRKQRWWVNCSYLGTAYHGWQIQPNKKTVQGVLEDTLSRVLKERVYVIGCGRTDSGVHASDYYFHIDVLAEYKSQWIEIINRNLPQDISIHSITVLPAKIHAQFDAVEREYKYRFHTQSNAFKNTTSTWWPIEPNLEVLNQCAASLLGKHDFRAFCLSPDKHISTVVEIYLCQWTFDEKREEYEFTVVGNRFLKGMIRALVGNMMNVVLGKISHSQFESALQSGERPLFFCQAPPQGLSLTRIEYKK